MRRILFRQLIVFLIGISYNCYSSENKYKFSDIPENLKKSARSVIRKNDVIFTIINPGEAKQTNEFAITILNQNGIKDAKFVKSYDKFTKIKNVRAVIYDAEGQTVKRYNTSDVKDLSARAGYSLYEDNRVKIVDPGYRTFPFTFEYSYEEDFNGILEYPAWYVYEDDNISIQESSITMICPNSLKLRYEEKDLPVKVQISEQGKTRAYFWEVSNLPALVREPMSMDFLTSVPSILFAPTDFEIAGVKGNSESWQNFGLWNYGLIKDRDILLPETVSALIKLTANCKDDYEKIDVLYKYFQEKTRYVNITIGLGGWQPIDAKTVDRLSYGDCKALSNYMKALLRAVGIRSVYSVIRAGEMTELMNTGFPSNQLNHVILCVPLKKDTLWLECTNQHMPMGYLGKFTDDRDVLLIEESGGKIAHTKCYSQSENQKNEKSEVKIDEDGQGTCDTEGIYTGIFYDEMYSILYSDDQDKRKIITNNIHLPSFKLLSYSHTIESERVPKIHESLRLELPNYASKINDRMLIPMNLMNKANELPIQLGQRRTAIMIRRGYEESDSIIYTLPSGYKMDKIPEAANINSIFGEYNASIKLLTDDKVLYIRSFKMNKGKYAPGLYGELKAFYEKVSNFDYKLRLSLRKSVI